MTKKESTLKIIDEKFNEIKTASKPNFKEWFKGWMISIKCFLFRWTGLYKCPHCDKLIDKLKEKVKKMKLDNLGTEEKKEEDNNQQKPNILIFAASPTIGTGYGLLHRNLGQKLSKLGYNVRGLGLQSYGESKFECSECKKETYPYGFEVLPIGDTQMGTDVLELYIKMFDIKILITLIDIIHPGFFYVADVVKKNKCKVDMPRHSKLNPYFS